MNDFVLYTVTAVTVGRGGGYGGRNIMALIFLGWSEFGQFWDLSLLFSAQVRNFASDGVIDRSGGQNVTILDTH